MASTALLPHEALHRSAHHLVRVAAALSGDNEAFLKASIPIAQQVMVETGVPASITLAQAIIESGWGHHHIGTANNYFGIKASGVGDHRQIGTIAIGFVYAGTTEYDKDHKLISQGDAFRAYTSMVDSFRDHGVWIRDNHRYGNMLEIFKRTGDADAVAEALERGGYAGLHNIVYASSLIAMMKRHKLYQYDKLPQNNVGYIYNRLYGV